MNQRENNSESNKDNLDNYHDNENNDFDIKGSDINNIDASESEEETRSEESKVSKNEEEARNEESIVSENENEVSSEASNEEGRIEKKSSMKKSIAELAIYVVLLLMCVFVVPKYVIQRTVVDGPSMENTLHSGENLIVDKITYRFSDPKRFDIIMFYPFGRDEKEYYVKRIIGLPGETVQIIGSDIYINNKKLEENYGKEAITDPGIAADPIKLADDEYFVLGDNREVSEDSRFTVGPVKRDLIEGKCLIRIWPLDEFGTVK